MATSLHFRSSCGHFLTLQYSCGHFLTLQVQLWPLPYTSGPAVATSLHFRFSCGHLLTLQYSCGHFLALQYSCGHFLTLQYSFGHFLTLRVQLWPLPYTSGPAVATSLHFRSSCGHFLLFPPQTTVLHSLQAVHSIYCISRKGFDPSGRQDISVSSKTSRPTTQPSI